MEGFQLDRASRLAHSCPSPGGVCVPPFPSALCFPTISRREVESSHTEKGAGRGGLARRARLHGNGAVRPGLPRRGRCSSLREAVFDPREAVLVPRESAFVPR